MGCVFTRFVALVALPTLARSVTSQVPASTSFTSCEFSKIDAALFCRDSKLSINIGNVKIYPSVEMKDDHFEPYVDNGGTVVAIAGENFAIVAADTRLSEGYSVLCRKANRIHSIGNGSRCIFVASAGSWSDVQGLMQVIRNAVADYEWEQERSLRVDSLARLLSNHLYYRRNFPYYTHNIIAGLDKGGAGAVYGYDSIGSYEQLKVVARSTLFRVEVAVAGSATNIIQPMLDILEVSNETKMSAADCSKRTAVDVPLESALKLVKEAFAAAAERDVKMGDDAVVVIMTKDGIREEKISLGLTDSWMLKEKRKPTGHTLI